MGKKKDTNRAVDKLRSIGKTLSKVLRGGYDDDGVNVDVKNPANYNSALDIILRGTTMNEKEVDKFRTKIGLMKAYKINPIVYACIKAISQEVSKVDIYIQKILNTNGDTEDIYSNEFIEALYNPNMYLTKTNFLKSLAENLLIYGEVFLRKIYVGGDDNSNGMIAGFEIISPLYIEKYVKEIDGVKQLTFKYTNINTTKDVSSKDDNFSSEYTENEILYIINPSPESPICPYSPLMSLATTVFLRQEANNYQVGGMTGGDVLSSGYLKLNVSDASGGLNLKDADDVKYIREQVDAIANRGGKKKFPVLPNGEIHKLNSTPNELDFIRTVETLDDQVQRAFGVPSVKLGALTDSNRASAEVVNRAFTSDVVEPLVKVITENLQKLVEELYPSDNYMIKYELSESSDDTTLTEISTQRYNAGVISLNEAREEIGYDSVENGDELGLGERNAPAFDDDGEIIDREENSVRVDRKRVMRNRVQKNMPKSISFKMSGIKSAIEESSNRVIENRKKKDYKEKQGKRKVNGGSKRNN